MSDQSETNIPKIFETLEENYQQLVIVMKQLQTEFDLRKNQFDADPNRPYPTLENATMEQLIQRKILYERSINSFNHLIGIHFWWKSYNLWNEFRQHLETIPTVEKASMSELVQMKNLYQQQKDKLDQMIKNHPKESMKHIQNRVTDKWETEYENFLLKVNKLPLSKFYRLRSTPMENKTYRLPYWIKKPFLYGYFSSWELAAACLTPIEGMHSEVVECTEYPHKILKVINHPLKAYLHPTAFSGQAEFGVELDGRKIEMVFWTFKDKNYTILNGNWNQE
jgi:hypothetical protein